MTTKPFPILDLPLLPVLEILRSLNPFSLFNLYECSGKSRRLVEEVHRKVASQYKLFVSLGEKCSIVGYLSRSQSTKMISVPIPENCSAQLVCDQILRIFKSIKVHAELSEDLHRILGWLVKHRDSLEHIDYLGAGSQPLSNLQKLLTTFSHCTWSNGRSTSEKVEKLIIGKAGWFIINNLFNFQGDNISLLSSSLTNADVNRFLTDWKSGVWNNVKTQVVFIRNSTIDISSCLENVPHQTFPIDPWRAKFQLLEVWYLIKHDDGTKIAKVYRSKKFEEANILIHFF